jgi:hypothetical protein
MKFFPSFRWPTRHAVKKWWKAKAKFLFALLGALVVIASFAIKDDRRDEVKSLADSIDRAEDTFILSGQNQRVYNLIQHNWRSIDVLQPSNTKKSSGWMMIDAQGRWITTAHEEVQNASVTLDSILRLGARLPEKYRPINEGAQIQLEIKEFNAEWDAFRAMKPPGPLLKDSFPHVYDDPKNSYFGKAMSVDAKCSVVLTKIQTLGVETLRTAKDAREEKEREYRSINLLSYVITFVGAGLTLVGVVLGIDPGKEG